MAENFKSRSDVDGLAECAVILNKICKQHDIKIWLNYGGLLGLIREGCLLSHNNDLELCCFFEVGIHKKLDKISKELSNHGYNCILYKSIGTLNIKKGQFVDVNLNLIWRDGDYAFRPHETASKQNSNIDLAYIAYWTMSGLYTKLYFAELNIFSRAGIKYVYFLFLRTILSLFGSKVRWRIFKILMKLCVILGGKFQRTVLPRGLFDDFKEIAFYSNNFLVPAEPEKVLEVIYGKEWKIPKDNWRFYSPENINETGVLIIDTPFDYSFVEDP